ncbi:iron chelate uptake ABC transporter family permease subunit, partial [Streptosporangium algeriense]
MSTAAVTARSPSAGSVLAVLRTRRSLVMAGLFALLLVSVLLSLAVGAKPVPPGDVWHALTSPASTENDIVVRSLRVPRTAVGAMAGIALGVAGALMQG